jgi:tetratricopeptide (TPR) repeat protein
VAVVSGSQASGVPEFGTGVPFQLPMPPHLFGRDAELAALEDLLAGRDVAAPLVVVLAGPAGVGKSALALRWLHRRRPRSPFSDGQLYAALGSRALESPQDILGRWLRSLGVPAEWIPAGGLQRTSLWRKASAGRRLAIMIDDASAEEISELLPGPGPAVVATTRHEVAGGHVDGAEVHVVALEPVPPDAALALMRHVSGAKRLASDPEAARELARLCGHMPLALRCAAGLLSIQGNCQVASVVGAVEAGLELAGADPGSQAATRAILALTYAQLSPGTARAYRLLGMHPGPDLGGSLAEAMLAAGPDDAAGAIEELRLACLLEDAGAERFRFHDVIRGHAIELAHQTDPPAGRNAADERNVAWHLHHAAAAERLLSPCMPTGRRDALDLPGCPAEFDTPVQALDWLDWERHNLTAALALAARSFPQACWQLADALWPLWYYRGHWGEALRTGRLGLAAARGCADRDAQARLHDRVGIACYHLGLYAEAEENIDAGCGFWNDVQPRYGHTLHGLTWSGHFRGWMAERAGDGQDAVSAYVDATSVYARAGDTRQEAVAKIDLGRVLHAAGVTVGAKAVLREAIESLGQVPDPFNAARARMVLARMLSPGHALAELQTALTVMEALDALPERVDILLAMCAVTGQAVHYGQARALGEQALALLPPWHDKARQVRAILSDAADGEVPR